MKYQYKYMGLTEGNFINGSIYELDMEIPLDQLSQEVYAGVVADYAGNPVILSTRDALGLDSVEWEKQ